MQAMGVQTSDPSLADAFGSWLSILLDDATTWWMRQFGQPSSDPRVAGAVAGQTAAVAMITALGSRLPPDANRRFRDALADVLQNTNASIRLVL